MFSIWGQSDTISGHLRQPWWMAWQQHARHYLLHEHRSVHYSRYSQYSATTSQYQWQGYFLSFLFHRKRHNSLDKTWTPGCFPLSYVRLVFWCVRFDVFLYVKSELSNVLAINFMYKFTLVLQWAIHTYLWTGWLFVVCLCDTWGKDGQEVMSPRWRCEFSSGQV